MTPAEMAALHAMAFPSESAWSEASFTAQLNTPHVHAFTAKDLADSYPMWDRFQKIRKQLDPEERFLNDYLKLCFNGA